MKRKGLWTWLAFVSSVVLAVAGLGFVSSLALSLEREEALARAEADHNERVRLALWRMDSQLTPLVASEASRPYFFYASFYSAERPYTSMWRPLSAAETMAPSPLLTLIDEQARGEAGELSDAVLLHFEVSDTGVVSSPQAPSGRMRDAAENGLVSPEAVRTGHARLAALRAALAGAERGRLETAGAAALSSEGEAGLEMASDAAAGESADYQQRQRVLERVQTAAASNFGRANAEAGGVPRSVQQSRREAAPGESDGRSGGAGGRPGAAEPAAAGAGSAGGGSAVDGAGGERAPAGLADALDLVPPVEDGPLIVRMTDPEVVIQPIEPLWLRGAARAVRGVLPASDGGLGRGAGGGGGAEAAQLLLVRTASTPDRTVLQGVWLDWERVRALLLSSVSDLLPSAELEPMVGGLSGSPSLQLASLPISLRAGSPRSPEIAVMSPTRVTLLLAWLSVAVAVTAIAVVLRASLGLSERRGRFVSSVTHELRTPLTTFTLYSQMLADGMVPEARRGEYLSTLRTEASRLAGIVENVLDYARLDQRRRPTAGGPIAADALVDRVLPALRDRAERGGLRLRVRRDNPEGLRRAIVRADPQTVERVLLNLVDNACKYASPPMSVPTEDERREVDVRVGLVESPRADVVEILIADRGPGVAPEARRQVFAEFGRAADAEREGQPGLGLGLALSRGLARELGGDLRLVRRLGLGAEFLLELPARMR